MLALAPPLTIALFLVPIGAGLIGTLLPAFGYLPAIGRDSFSLEPWHELFATPGIATTLYLTLFSGLATTLVALALAVAFCAFAHHQAALRRLDVVIAALLATPHAAIAFGFAFLILPSGWIARALSPELTGWLSPPPLVTVRDPYALSFAAGLLLKEVPYLVLMIVGASAQVRAPENIAAARALGYRPAKAWLAVVLPRLYPQIRLPIYAVLAFSLSVVDVALVLAPGTPPPLAVLAARWFAAYDLSLYPRAAAAAVLQLVVVALAIGAWRLGELAVAAVGRAWIARGRRGGASVPAVAFGGGLAIALGLAAVVSLAGMALWSVADEWRFPDAIPTALTSQVWGRQLAQVSRPTLATLWIGLGAMLIAVALALACLEHEQRARLRPGANALWLLYLPLLVPQIAFWFGAQVALVRIGLDGTVAAVVWGHLIYVLPYVFLSLADPYRALDPRYARSAASLGASATRTFFTVKLPMLLKPLAIAGAVGFAVSVGQYLPTLFAGAGRIATLTTEAVTLSAGADRRVLGVYAVLQAAMPALLYAAALLVPAFVYRHRRGLA
jgi:putative thiamine transport system permease protein